MKLGRADDLDDSILCQIRVDLCVLQDRADEGRAPGFRKLQVFPCRLSDRDVGRLRGRRQLQPNAYHVLLGRRRAHFGRRPG